MPLPPGYTAVRRFQGAVSQTNPARAKSGRMYPTPKQKLTRKVISIRGQNRKTMGIANWIRLFVVNW